MSAPHDDLAFAEIKAYLRRVAARTREMLEIELGHAVDRVTPHHATNYCRHCGYRAAALRFGESL